MSSFRTFFLFLKRHFAVFFRNKKTFLLFAFSSFLLLCVSSFFILFFAKDQIASIKDYQMVKNNGFFKYVYLSFITVLFYVLFSFPQKLLGIIFNDRVRKERDFLVSPISYNVLMFSYLFFIFIFISLFFNLFFVFLFTIIKFLKLEHFSNLDLSWLCIMTNVLIFASSAFNIFISSIFEKSRIFAFFRIYFFLFLIFPILEIVINDTLSEFSRDAFLFLMIVPSRIIFILIYYFLFFIMSFLIATDGGFTFEPDSFAERFFFPEKGGNWFDIKSVSFISISFKNIFILGLIYSVIFVMLIFLVNLPSLRKKIR